MIYRNVRITEVRRLRNSTSGNPNWSLQFLTQDGQTLRSRTAYDGSVGYEVTRWMEGTYVDLECHPSGTIYKIARNRPEPAEQPNEGTR